MKLKELHLFGFKSFPEKTVIKFSEGITAILGPNGCGKTNILDALRWVLGEQNLSLIRCTRNEELIFAGTKNRPPLNFCEVKLILENDGGELPYGSEIEIKRRYFRTGEMEYFLNRQVCRLKDIQELFTRTGSKAYSLFSLSDIRRIIHGEVRRFFDEAANLKKYQENKKDTLQKLELTERDLQRLEDIIRERKRIVSSLRRQKRRWEIYEALRREEKRLRLSEIRMKVGAQEEKLALLRSEMASLKKEEELRQKEMGEKEAELKGLREIIKQEEKRREGLQGEIAHLKDSLARLSQELIKCEERLSFLKERKDRLLKERGLSAVDAEAVKERREKLCQISQKEETLQQELEGLRAEVKILEKEISEKEAERERVERERVAIFDEIINVSSELSEERSRMAIIGEQISGLDDITPVSNILGKVAEYLSFSPDYEKAVEAALYPYHSFYLLKDLDIRGKTKEKEIGFIIKNWRPIPKKEGIRPPLLSLAEIGEIKEGCPELILSRLTATFLVEDYEQAKRYIASYPDYAFVTKEGICLRPDGVILLAGLNQTTELAITRLREEMAQKEEEKKRLEDIKRGKEEKLNHLGKEIEILKEKSKEKLKLSSELLLTLAKVREEKKVLEAECQWREEEMAKDRLKEEDLKREIMATEIEERGLAENYYQKAREEEEIKRLIKEKEEEIGKINLAELKDQEEKTEKVISGKREEIENLRQKKGEKQLEEFGVNKEIEDGKKEMMQLLKEMGVERLEEEVVVSEGVEERLREIEKKFLTIGKVNPLAKEEFEREKTELDRFLKERDDCQKAAENLKAIIGEIDRRVKEDFLNTFEKVRENFREIFARLFIAGEGNLILANPDNPIESEIIIVAKPQGKNPRRLEQLSDGEKALLSLALLFAFYKVKPAPFSFWDEIDAPLDDANVERFAQFLREISKDTQVVIITHNRLTLEKVDVLLGVTAEEPGVSKIVTMKLKDLNSRKES